MEFVYEDFINSFSIDYITFTVRAPYWSNDAFTNLRIYIDDLRRVTDGFITIDKFEKCNYGRNHFNRMYKWAGENRFFLCAADDCKNMDKLIMVQISGLGIKEIGTDIFYAIIKHAVEKHVVNCTRLDLCYDDFDKTIPRDKIYRSFKSFMRGKKTIESRFSRESVQVFDGIYDDVPYRNVTFGTRVSSQYMRLYDKRAEQGAKGVPDLPAYWYRLELELRRETAQAALQDLIKSDFDICNAWQLYINRMFRILAYVPEGSQVVNSSRVPTAPWWLKFVGNDAKGKVKFHYGNVDQSIDSMLEHIYKNYAGYLYTLQQVAPGRLKNIVEQYGAMFAEKPKYQKILKGMYDMEF